MTNKEYRQHEGISKSQLHKLTISPFHFKYYLDNPQPDTPSLKLGRAVHKYILEKDDFFNEYLKMPSGINKRTKEGKQTIADYEARAAQTGKELITEEELEKIKAMAEVIHSNKICQKLLSGEHEQSYFWVDEETKEPCKCRPDATVQIGDECICIDYKTTANAESQSFMNSAIKFGYDLQAGMYLEGLKKSTGKNYTKFVFIAQETVAPYAFNILEADEYFITEGTQLFHDLLGIYHECKETDNWPGYMGASNEISSLSVPKWLQRAFNTEAENEETEGDFE